MNLNTELAFLPSINYYYFAVNISVYIILHPVARPPPFCTRPGTVRRPVRKLQCTTHPLVLTTRISECHEGRGVGGVAYTTPIGLTTLKVLSMALYHNANRLIAVSPHNARLNNIAPCPKHNPLLNFGFTLLAWDLQPLADLSPHDPCTKATSKRWAKIRVG